MNKVDNRKLSAIYRPGMIKTISYRVCMLLCPVILSILIPLASAQTAHAQSYDSKGSIDSNSSLNDRQFYHWYDLTFAVTSKVIFN